MRAPVIISFLFLFLIQLPASDNPVYQYIEQEDLNALEVYLQDNDINAILKDSNTTLLVYAIEQGSYQVCRYLIEHGANVNQYTHGYSPLMHASLNAKTRIVRQLVKASADIMARDSLNNTILFHAAYGGNVKICKLLLESGAPLNHRNRNRRTAYDYAILAGQTDAALFLRHQYEKTLPDMRDGPYVKWGISDRIRAFYIVHDSTRQATRKIKMNFKVETDSFLMQGFAGDSLDYQLLKSNEIPSARIEGVEKILVVGDIHGGYDSLVNFLENNQIIDGNLNWTWGRGHVVFLGDIFDRGDKVTEALWLIYNLEGQARHAGGAVHLILGNHEIMVLQGEMFYVSNKYLLLTEKLNINYSRLFNRHTLLGKWLRNKNTILKINDNLFVHAGLSPSISSSGLTMENINEITRFFLNHPDRDIYMKVKRPELFGTHGPFWYRGFIEGNHQYEHLPESEFEKSLTIYDAARIFIGHTNVDQITPLYNSRVYAMDVPFYSYGYSMEALLLEGDAVFVLNSNGLKKSIHK
jgi:hypothetical protein